MENVVLVIHLILALGIIGLVLIQRSEGGGLGIGGGGGGMGGFATPKGTASVLTKLTAFFAFCFFATSLTLAILAGTHSNKAGILAQYGTEAEITSEERAAASEASLSENEGSESGENSIETPAETLETPIEKPSVPLGE